MTQDFSQQFQPYGFDYYTAGTQPSEVGVVPAQRNRLRVWTPGEWTKEDRDRFGMWEVTLRDFSLQGLNHPVGLFSEHSNGFTVSSLITDEPNSLHLPPTRLSNSAPIPSGDIVGLHSCFIFDTLIVGAGSGANVSLWKETSSTDSTPSAITYSPSASICSLSSVLDDGVARLAVGRIGAATQLHSDASATVATTMHTSTNSTWGIIMSGVGTTPGVPVMLIYAGTTIGRKSTDADLTTTIGTEFTGVNAGGFAVGAIHPEGRAEKAVWAIPKVTTTAGALKYGAEVLMELWVTDMELATIDRLRLKYLPDGIRGAVPYRVGLVAWDDTHIVYWDGAKEYDLGIFRRRIGQAAESWTESTLNADVRRRIRSVKVVGADLYVLINGYTLPDTTSLVFYYMEKYRYESGSWHQSGQIKTSSTSASNTITAHAYLCGQGGMPFSPNTYRAQNRETHGGEWVAWFLQRPAESLLWQHSLGSGSATTNIPTFTFDAPFLSPEWRLDGIELNPKVVTRQKFGGNMNPNGTPGAGQYTLTSTVRGHQITGTTASTVIAAQAVFSPGKNVVDYDRNNKGWVNVSTIQLHLAPNAVGGSALRTNFEMLPQVITGIYSKDVSKPITSTYCPAEFA